MTSPANSIFPGTRGWPGPRSCRSSSLEVLCSCQEVASTGASRQATVGAGGCAHWCQAPAAHRHRHRSAAPSLLARNLLLVLLRGSFLPELPAPDQAAFAASFQALLSVEVQDFLLQFSWPFIKELTAHIYGLGLNFACTQILAICLF